MNTTNENKEHDLNAIAENDFADSTGLMPDQPFKVSFESTGQNHDVIVQWMGESRGVQPGYYVFEGERYTKEAEQIVIEPELWAHMSDEELKAAYPDDEELNPAEATKVLEYKMGGVGWTERGAGQTTDATELGKVIDKVFSA